MYKPVMVEPEIVKETFFDFEDVSTECFKVNVSGEEWRICNTTKRWSDTKTGHYGVGIKNSADDPRKVTRIGCLGEMCFAKVFGLGFDDEFKDGGDNFDFVIHGEKIDVKMKTERSEIGFVYARNQWGRDIPISMDRYVFGYLQNEDRASEMATCILCGWQTKAFVEKLPLVKAPGNEAQHFNKECRFSRLLSMQSLNDWSKRRHPQIGEQDAAQVHIG